ncbi:sensor domain-containing diguanylate cyclase [Vibrio sp. DW001]|uniref:sensor domain-containing diguanylate cyclase n=1 Tax=Vibrio sp. DW001 TaxID=2912315 RepID=UPI0023AF3BD5|nr:sensor domain-containing diguanylate cyclase [Vibrio sp. DW001]WED26628.1 sensor domain-containing diguanylate cyclase [Vibrio sp. DW001]
MEKTEPHYLEKELQKTLAQDPAIFQFLQTSCLDGVFFWDLENQEHKWMSDNFWKVLGYDPTSKQHLLSDWCEVINQEDMEQALNNFKLHCENPAHPYNQIVRYKHKDGSTVWVRCRGFALRDKNGKAIRILGAHTDVTQLKETEEDLKRRNEELKNLARHDPHTSLYNRFAFAEIFEQQLLIAAREHMPISLAMVDVDNFKVINDALGHLEGDKILLDVSNTLRKVARDSDIIGRFGGDEFIVLMFNSNHREAQLAAERLRMGVEECVTTNSGPVTISVGVSTFGEKSIAGIDLTPSEIYEKMLGTADKALFRAKDNGRNQICY